MRKILIFAFLTIFLSVSAFAEDNPVGGGCGPDGEEICNETGEEIPLDEHVLYLVGGSIALGIAYHRRVERSTPNA